MSACLRTALCCATLTVPAAPAAEPATRAPAATTGATAATVRAPGPYYDSAFSGYQRYRAQPVAPWRDVNDQAHKAGGHAGLFRGDAGGHAGGATSAPDAAPAAHPPEHRQ